MKKITTLIGLVALLSGCKKNIENIREDLVIKAMTDGQWAVTSFTQNGAIITADFSTYKFKYYSNKTVDAINNGVVERTGTWDGDSGAMTTSASFSSPDYPLMLINGSWHIDNNSWTFVVATQTNGSETKTMRLDKQ
jgi:Prokaryotic membrane lipoprotein lipid attachment site